MMKSLNLFTSLAIIRGFGSSSFNPKITTTTIIKIPTIRDLNRGRLPCLRVSGGMGDKKVQQLKEEGEKEVTSIEKKNGSGEEGKDLLNDSPPSATVPPLPTPPEKPLAGDCCGSGCVRCVWDIYYDELEDYNNLLKIHSQSKS